MGTPLSKMVKDIITGVVVCCIDCNDQEIKTDLGTLASDVIDGSSGSPLPAAAVYYIVLTAGNLSYVTNMIDTVLMAEFLIIKDKTSSDFPLLPTREYTDSQVIIAVKNNNNHHG